MKFIPATTKHRPWPLPDGFKYCEKDYKLRFIDDKGCFKEVKGQRRNLLVRNRYGLHFWVTKDHLVFLKVDKNGIMPDLLGPHINLYKPI